MWLKRVFTVYVVVWALYFGAAIYLHRQMIGTPAFSPYAWGMFMRTALWPYVLVQVWNAPDLASALRGDAVSDQKR